MESLAESQESLTNKYLSLTWFSGTLGYPHEFLGAFRPREQRILAAEKFLSPWFSRTGDFGEVAVEGWLKTRA